MTAIRGLLQADPGGDFWSRLLGIDRVRMEGGEISLAWRQMPEMWILILVIIPAITALAWLVYRAERKDVGTGPKAVLTALRAMLVLLVLLLLMGPVLTVETIKIRRGYLIVLLDESRSMRKSDPLPTAAEKRRVGWVTGDADDNDDISPSEETALRSLTRAEIVRRVLLNPRLKILDPLEEKLNVAYFTFSSGAAPRESRAALLEGYRAENCLGAETAIGDAIKAALNSLKGQHVVGVVVFSDGKNNSGMATVEIAKQLRQRYLPIYTVAAGVPHTPRDIGISELEARDAVLANDELQVNFKLRSFGYENESLDVRFHVYTIKEKDKEPGTSPQELERLIEQSRKELDHRVTLQGRSQKQAETIRWVPKVPGDYLLTLSVDPRADENSAHNNYLVHRLRVADDKIKVLYVEHPPRYEYRYLKNALIRDPKILAHCLLTSADEGFPQEHTRSDDPLFRQPLQEFPKDLKALLEFDVILYGDVEPGRLSENAARNIEAFVSEFGGGIIFMSGMMHNPRSLANTPMANLLPVVPDDTRDPFEHDKIYVDEFHYQLTPDGKASPITTFKEFRGDRERNLEHWEDRDQRGDGLRGIRWYQRVRKLKAGATPLVELTGVPGETTRPPLFVTQHVGRGRVFWSATEETWLWRYLRGDYPWFYPFWQQAMYWVREGKLLGARRFRVNVDKERYTRGESVQVYVNAYDERFELRQDPALEVFVDPPAGDRIRLELLKDRNRDGYYEGAYLPADTGLYRIWAGDEDESTRAVARFNVYIPDREEDEPILDVATLAELAEESAGGKFFPIDQVGGLPEAVRNSDQQLREVKEDDLWDSPLVYLLFALLITAEWILRKVFRML